MSTPQHVTPNAELSGDPTNTRGLREAFIREIARRFRRLRGLVRRSIGYENDAANLSGNAEDAETFEFSTDDGLIQAFTDWLRAAIRDEVLEPVPQGDVLNGGHWTAGYVRSAYRRAWEDATGRLLQEGVAATQQDFENVFNLPVPRRQLQQIYSRTYENLQGITDDAADSIRDVFTEGLASGWNPRKMASELNAEINSIQQTRAEVLARTETINSYSVATLDRYERAGVGEVTVSGEWATADDNDVCPICDAVAGTVATTSRLRNGTFQFDAPGDAPDYLAGTYPLRPPAHPNCRCAILPVVE